MNKKEQTCCFTGHRIIPQEQYEYIEKRLKYEITQLIEQGVIYFLAGGALGFDTIAAQVIIEFRKKYPTIKLILVLPCENQSVNWGKTDRLIYEKIKSECDMVHFISEKYTKDCMFERNRYLVNNSNYCINYLTKSSGGTAYTVNYAKKKCLKLINISPATITCLWNKNYRGEAEDKQGDSTGS